MKNKTKSLGDSVASQIKEAIFKEEKYKPGEQLPVEKKLAEELNVSRTALREGIKILEFEGILEIRRGVGTFVPDDFGLGVDIKDLSFEEFQRKCLYDWYEARLGWEVHAMQLVAARATDEELNELEMLQEQCDCLIDHDDHGFYKLDHQFHKKLTEATHNKVLERIIYSTGIWEWSYYNIAQNRNSLQEYMKANSTQGHHMILKFLKKRDGEGAALAMRYHLLQAQEDLSR